MSSFFGSQEIKKSSSEGVALEGEPAPIDESNISTTAVPESEKSSFVAFVKKAMGGIDLSKLTAPPFILAPSSMLETNSDHMVHPETFTEIGRKELPEERFIEYVRWYISRYHKQSTTGSGKKPYNPILGEKFLCHWEDPSFGRVDLISEQVSHHPPVLAEYYENRKYGVVNMSHWGLKSNFAGTIVKARAEAHNWTRLILKEEDYVCTFPTFVIRGFLVANPFLDVVGEALLHCTTTGYKAILDYKDKPWFRGEYHQMEGRIFHEDNPNENLYTISGNWKKVVWITNSKTGQKSVLFDTAWKFFDRKVAPIEEQDPLESQRVWKDVTDNLKEYNYSAAGEAKGILEDRQRELARQRKETGQEFPFTFFYWDEEAERWLLKDYEQRFEDIANESH